MTFLTRYWQLIGLSLAILSLLWLAAYQPTLSRTSLLLYLNLLALWAHQFEEYQFPGGAAPIINRVVYKEKEKIDCYPGNSLSIMFVNGIAWAIYGLALIFPEIYGLGLGVMLFSLFQVVGHGIQMPLALKTYYNPGLFTTVFLFVPISVTYILTNSFSIYDWIIGILILASSICFSIVLPVQLLKNPKTSFVIDKKQMSRYYRILAFTNANKHSK